MTPDSRLRVVEDALKHPYLAVGNGFGHTCYFDIAWLYLGSLF